MLYKCGKLQLFTSLLQHHGGSWALIRPTLDGNRTSRPRRKENPHASLSEPMSLLPQRLPQELRLLEGLSGAKKKYLKFYDALCAQSLRQLTAGQSRRPAW